LHRLGFWNEELANEWSAEADYILIEKRYYENWLKEYVNAGEFDELEMTPHTAYCRQDSQIRIFRRKPN